METPDKIYIEIDNKAHVYFGLQPENAVEYIRKDTLLEWLQNENWFYKTHSKPNAVHSSRCEAYKSVIDKIESL